MNILGNLGDMVRQNAAKITLPLLPPSPMIFSWVMEKVAEKLIEDIRRIRSRRPLRLMNTNWKAEDLSDAGLFVPKVGPVNPGPFKVGGGSMALVDEQSERRVLRFVEAGASVDFLTNVLKQGADDWLKNSGYTGDAKDLIKLGLDAGFAAQKHIQFANKIFGSLIPSIMPSIPTESVVAKNTSIVPPDKALLWSDLTAGVWTYAKLEAPISPALGGTGVVAFLGITLDQIRDTSILGFSNALSSCRAAVVLGARKIKLPAASFGGYYARFI